MTQAINKSATHLKSPCGGFRVPYIAPRIEIISLDNEISLALESTPPVGPEEVYLDTNKQHIDPFQTNLG